MKKNFQQDHVSNSHVLFGKSNYKTIIFSMMMLLVSSPIFAVDAQITTWGDIVKTSLDAAVAVFAVVGGFLIFIQYMQGNEQAQKNLIRFVIGLGVFGLAELILVVFIP
ncbi:MAG: hypothetical protein AAGB24_13950 [Bacteroidota bacterium]